jgi:hypothetical protein
MKHSSTWFALILIASALLLSAAKLGNANAQSALPSARNEQQSQTTDRPTDTSYPTPAPAAPVPSLTVPETTPQTPDASAKPTNRWQQLYQHVWPPLWSTFSPPVWSNWGLIVVAAVAAYVGLMTLDAIRRSNRVAVRVARAANKSANAARKSADVAERQLHRTERPWIAFEATKILGTKYIVDRIKRLHPMLQEKPDSLTVEIIQVSVQYRFDNCGRTPARLVGGDVQLICADPKSLPVEPIYRFISTPESLLPPGYSADNSLTVRLFPPAFEKFVRRQESLILFGFVQYRDVIGEDNGPLHESRFRMECEFPGYDIGKSELVGPFYFAFAGADSYNRYT